MKAIDLAGKKIGEWTVLARDYETKRCGVHWMCQCSCGNIKSVNSQTLRNGMSRSCGCQTKKFISQKNRKHGKTGCRLSYIWNMMKQRCYNKNNAKYPNYGGRGITVCDEWLKDFMIFYNWAMSHGYAKNLSIDRKDNNGNYSPSNCRWTNNLQQANNKTTNHFILYNGRRYTMSEMSRLYGINYSILKYRLKSGWSVERAISIQPRLGRNQFG